MACGCGVFPLACGSEQARIGRAVVFSRSNLVGWRNWGCRSNWGCGSNWSCRSNWGCRRGWGCGRDWGCGRGRLVLGHSANVNDQVPYFGVLCSARILRRHLVFALADLVEKLLIRFAAKRLWIGPIQQRQTHVLGQVGLAVSIVSMANRAVHGIHLLRLLLRRGSRSHGVG